jgi:hypothetical protein
MRLKRTIFAGGGLATSENCLSLSFHCDKGNGVCYFVGWRVSWVFTF